MWLYHTHTNGGQILGENFFFKKVFTYTVPTPIQHKNSYRTRPAITILTTPFFLSTKKKLCTLNLHSTSSIADHNLSLSKTKQSHQSLFYTKPTKPETICPFHLLYRITTTALLDQTSHHLHLHC